MWKIISKNALVLTSFAFVCLTAVIAVHWLTKGRIAEEQLKAEYKNLTDIFANINLDAPEIQINCYQISNLVWLGSGEAQKVYTIFKDQTHIATFINTVAPDGYNGAIGLNLGVDNQGAIQGIRIATHKETPGLGDKIELGKSDWVLAFNGLSLASETKWDVKKQQGDFDAFAGATITPRAVIKAIKRTLEHMPDAATIQREFKQCKQHHATN